MLDLSLKGARILTETAIEPGDHVTLQVRFPLQLARMRIEVATVRWEKDRTYGIEFIRLSAVAERRLRMFLAATARPVEIL